ncbi:hypothetical protein MSAR_29540 [Mycolicibacterium sarraceniae]|uniref:Uncharacterized protein n=1 Tax=Mycolicibacterium sarraceniae TaxID=1534348 RepID=A0A7I7SSM1_9MYCO|nr:hypothetical protein MSAR_29540 [Mycolicibacterium sarraceniae]
MPADLAPSQIRERAVDERAIRLVVNLDIPGVQIGDVPVPVSIKQAAPQQQYQNYTNHDQHYWRKKTCDRYEDRDADEYRFPDTMNSRSLDRLPINSRDRASARFLNGLGSSRCACHLNLLTG